jgi:hypothetical protein
MMNNTKKIGRCVRRSKGAVGILSGLAVCFVQSALGSDWVLLQGPEKENGDPIEIVSAEADSLELALWKKRGHVARGFAPTELPAVITFDWETEFDPTMTEVATELWGTGDFRISLVGSPSGEDLGEMTEANLGQWEGVQFRVFPHLDQSPIRRRTEPNNESHTATSIWVRYTNPDRLFGDDGAPHTGLQSDACQNRNREDGTHNCGWDRHTIVEGGFGLANQQKARVMIYVSESEVYLAINGRRYAIEPEAIRYDALSAIVVGITNTSRGFRSLKLTNLQVAPASPPNDLVNISTRGLVGSGDEIMIAGYVSEGDAAGDTVLMRGVGPALGDFGVSNPVEDPVLKVFDSDGQLVAENDDWAGNEGVVAASQTVGAFALAPDSADAALLLSGLPPGQYTVQLSGKQNFPGNGLIEVYRITDPR